MAISDEITRLQQAKAALKTSIEGKGVTVSSSATLDDYPALVDSIEAGGGGGGDDEVIEVHLQEDEVYTINVEEFQASGKAGHRVYYCKDSSGEGAKVVVRRNGTTLKTISLGTSVLLFWKDSYTASWYWNGSREWLT